MPRLCSSANWTQTGIVFVDKSVIGEGPYSVFVDQDDTVYVSSREKDKIFAWFEGNLTANRTHVLPYEIQTSVIATTNKDIYYDLRYNNINDMNIYKWEMNATSGTLVMKFQTNIGSRCFGLAVDKYGDIYCSAQDDHAVFKRRLQDDITIVSIVAGKKASGFAADQLSSPYGIFVTVELDLYVADCGNDRIQLFKHGSRNGTTVVSKLSVSSIGIECPKSVILDQDRNIFLLDSKKNRVLRCNSSSCSCIVGCHTSSGVKELHEPTAMSFDSKGNIFVADTKNNRIMKFNIINKLCDGE